MDKIRGYEVVMAVMFENGDGIALGHNPKAPQPFVTWACYNDRVSGKREYEWGHYGSDRAKMEADLLERLEDYQRQFRVDAVCLEAPGLYKYYSTQRPVDIGTFPKGPGKEPDEIQNFDERIPVEDGAFLAWGYLTYTRPLSEQDVFDYELRPAPENPDLRRDQPRPIAEQLAEAGRAAAYFRVGQKEQMDGPDRGGDR